MRFFPNLKPYRPSPRESGYILIESIVAITIVIVGLLGIFALLSRSLSLNRVVADRFVASYLAAEGIEIVKNIADDNILAGRPWNAGLASGEYEADYRSASLEPATGRRIRITNGTGAYGYAEAEPTAMVRTITIGNSPDGERLSVGSRVAWTTRGGGKFSIDTQTFLYHWR